MKNKQLEDLMQNSPNVSIEEIWNKFKYLSESEQKELFLELINLAKSPKHNNKAIVYPNVASVIKRKLKSGVEFNKWYESWLPPVQAQKIGNDEVRDYFPIPTRVINLCSGIDEKEFLTIGFVYNPFDNIEELLNARPKEIKSTESNRKDVNDDLLEYSENIFYSVVSDDIFGL